MKKIAAIILLITFISGCATVTYTPPDDFKKKGVYHRVRPNETLWSISKIYDVNLKDIVDSNRIPNANKISVGQLIFIPGKTKRVDFSLKEISGKHEVFIWPVKGKVISHFGSTDKYVSKNKGIDISVPYGTHVKASRSGKITYCSDFMKGYGKMIILDHAGGYQTVYAYNKENLVKLGDEVCQGQVIAKVGKGGRAPRSSLHFEIRKQHKSQNPFFYLP